MGCRSVKMLKCCENCKYAMTKSDLGTNAPSGQKCCRKKRIFVLNKSQCEEWEKKIKTTHNL